MHFSEQPRNSVRTSFGCCSICLWKVRDCGNSRRSLNFSLSYFDLSTAELCIKLKGGGWDKIMDLMSRKGERVKLKIFAMLINFKTCCPRGEEDHLKAAINLSCYALLRNPNSDFPCGKDRCFLPRLLHFLGWAKICNCGRKQRLNNNIVNAVNIYTLNSKNIFYESFRPAFFKRLEVGLLNGI